MSSPPLVPPFTAATAQAKLKLAQSLWNTRNPSQIAAAYTPDTIWRNRDVFLRGTSEVTEFLTQKFARENGYRLRKELFTVGGERGEKIAVQFWYEYYLDSDEEAGKRQWYRAYGLEDWTFAADGKMEKRMMSANDIKISDDERWFKDGVEVDDVELPEGHI